MCGVTAAVAGVGLAVGAYQARRARREAKKARRAQEKAAADEKRRIDEGVEQINLQFGDPRLQSSIDALVQQRQAGGIDQAEASFERHANALDLRLARAGLGAGFGRDQLYRNRLRRSLAAGRAGAAVDASRVRSRLQDQLERSRIALIDRVRSGAAAPGAETTIASQTAQLQEAAANVPSQTAANVVNQTAGVIQTDTAARGRGNTGLAALDFMNRT